MTPAKIQAIFLIVMALLFCGCMIELLCATSIGRAWRAFINLPVWRRPISGLYLLAALILLLLIAPAFGRDLDGRFMASPLKPWFDSLQSGKGPCCSDADGWALADVDWESRGGRYRVRVPREQWLPSKSQPAPPAGVEMIWIDVDDDAVISEPNRDGRTMVWPIWSFGGLTIRCFMPGSMT